MIVNAENQILGRMATQVSKHLKKGEEVIIVNAEKCVISGGSVSLFKDFRAKRKRGHRYFGPFYPKMPDRIIKRAIRGMLPKRKDWGKGSMVRLKVYNGVPCRLNLSDSIQFEGASKDRLKMGLYLPIGEISKHLGSKVIQ